MNNEFTEEQLLEHINSHDFKISNQIIEKEILNYRSLLDNIRDMSLRHEVLARIDALTRLQIYPFQLLEKAKKNTETKEEYLPYE